METSYSDWTEVFSCSFMNLCPLVREKNQDDFKTTINTCTIKIGIKENFD